MINVNAALRSRQTDAEDKLWQALRAKRFCGLKFKRQVLIGPYVADFSCRSKMIIIEVDGSQHWENEKDKVRDAFLEQLGYRVLRYWNNEVVQSLDDVLEDIHIQIFEEG